MNQKIIKIEDEKYENLVEECKAIIIETLTKSRMDLLEGKWLLGKRIVAEEMNFEKGIYGQRTVYHLARDLELSDSHLYKVIQFYKKYQLETFDEVFPRLPEGKNLTWYLLCQKYLPRTKEEIKTEEQLQEKQKSCPHAILICKNCKKEFDFNALQKIIKNRTAEKRS